MSTPIIGPLVRTNYLSYPPGVYDASADPNSSAFDPAFNAASPVAPVVVAPSPGVAQTGPNYGDAAIDMEGYHRPLERLHGTGLHGAGVAYGLQIASTKGSPNVHVYPGLALDSSGKHIYLAATGMAEINPEANVQLGVSTLAAASGTPPSFKLYSAPQAGAPGDIAAAFTGIYYVVAQWRETFDASAYASDPNVLIYNDTPWLQLVNTVATGQVVLGQVTFDGSGNVLSVGAGDSHGMRVAVSVPAQSLQLHRTLAATAGSKTTISGTQDATPPIPAGEVRSRAAGGIEVAVANNSDQITVLSDAGGSFSTFAVGANLATVGDLANPGIQLNGSEATIRVGAPGNYGDVLVYDGSGHLSVSLIGDTAHVIVGGNTLPGEVRMFDGNANQSMTLDGSIGAANVQQLNAYPAGQNGTIDVNAQKVHIHGWDLCLDGRSQHNGTKNSRALVDWGNKLIVNYNGDYRNGVEIQSDLQVDGNLQVNNDINLNGVLSAQGWRLMGNPARKVQFALMLAGTITPGGVPSRVTQDVDLSKVPNLTTPTQFTAFCTMSLINSTTTFDYDNGVSAEVWMVDGTETSWVFEGAGGKWGNSGGDPNNAYQPFISTTGTVITFRLAAIGPDVQAEAFGTVFFE